MENINFDKINIAAEALKVNNELPKLSEVSNESFSGFLVKITEKFKSSLSKVSSFMSSKVNKLLGFDKKGHSEFLKEMKGVRKTIEKVSKKTEFKKVAMLEMPVMIGLKLSAIDVTNILLSNKDMLQNVIEPIDELYGYVGNLLSSSDYRNATKPIVFNHIFDNYKLSGIISDIIDPNDHTDIKTIEEVFNNYNASLNVIENLISVGEGTSLKEMNVIMDKISALNNRINMLLELMEKEDFTMSKRTTEHLANKIEDVANYITNVSAIYHIVNQLASMVVRYSEIIKKVK